MSGISKPHFYLTTLGCKLNFAESAAMVRKLSELGWQQTSKASEASWIVVHSCAVTHTAEKKTRQLISKLLRSNAEASVAVTGCMADVNVDSLTSMLEGRHSIILSNSQKMQLPGLLAGVPDYHGSNEIFAGAYSLEQRTRSFLKIQDGCDNFCTYCTVPYARGRSRSHTIDGVLNDIAEISVHGFREINLTGVNIATFGQERGESFLQLLQAIDQQCSDIRIRLGSNEPDLLNDEIISLVAQSNVIMPHFHIPLQSGTDSVLKRMNRHYDTALFRSKVEQIKAQMPHACVAADVITGFPGETDEEFEQTFQFIKSLDISYLHVFPYSDRPLAKASQYDNKVNPHEIRHRVDRLLELGQSKQAAFFQQNIGTVRTLLTETSQKDGLRFGFTDNYIKCAVLKENVKENELVNVKLLNLPDEKEFVFVDLI